MSQIKIWKILELLNTTTAFFEQKGIENPRLNTEQLLGKTLTMSRVDLYLSFERPLSISELNIFREFVRRRSQREPLQYILGESEFMGLPFTVNPSVLIPRPETEVLVEEVLKLKETFGTVQPLIVDVGTGSGCIPLSLAHFWKEAACYGLDVSAEALNTARSNAALNHLEEQVQFIEHDVFEKWNEELPDKIQILISNPPYISEAEMSDLQPEVRDYEPRIALSDEGDGLRFYRRLFALAASESVPYCDYMFVEMSGSQPERITALAEQYDFHTIESINDLNGIPRVLKVKVKNG